MSKFNIPPNLITSITPWSNESIKDKLIGAAVQFISSATSQAYPSSNLAIYVPFYTPRQLTVAQLFWINGAAVSGNVDCGVYDSEGNRIISAGTTAQAGTGNPQIQIKDVTDVLIGPGKYYIALACDNQTATFFASVSQSLSITIACGIKQQASAFVLPAASTMVQSTFAYIPIFGFTTRSVL